MRPRVYTGGTFDCFHPGHVNLLRACSRLGDVTVALNTDEFVAGYKGRKPVMCFEERQTVLFACRYVTNVVACDGDSVSTVERARPDYLVVGSDWATRDYYAQMGFTQDWLDERGITLCFVPYTRGISTSDIRDRLS